MPLTFRYTSILRLVQPENEKPVVEGREEEISDEKANAESPISLSSGLRRRSAAHAEVRPSYQDRREISEHLSNWMQKLRLTLRSTGLLFC
jgi:hypothetical protein